MTELKKRGRPRKVVKSSDTPEDRITLLERRVLLLEREVNAARKAFADMHDLMVLNNQTMHVQNTNIQQLIDEVDNIIRGEIK